MAKNTQAKEYILPIQLPLNQEVYGKLVDAVGGEDLSVPVSKLLQDFLVHWSQGGFVITGSDIARMTKASDSVIDSAKKVVEAVDKSAGRKDGAHAFTVCVDPNMIGQLVDVAASRSMTLQDLIQESWDTIVAMGWLYAVPAHCSQFTVSESQHAQIAQALGQKHFTGADIAEAFTRTAKA